ncbi:MAG: hypothetical protein EXS41_09570 [Opitutaceae bacterium]|nr:hypothetical protein [Opitutaceae bacterium]
MRPKFLALAFCCAITLLLFGCNTAAVRVLTNYETFSKLDPKVRANILRGRVELGSTPGMVRLALGRPDYSSSSAGARAGREIWSHTGLDVTKPTGFDSNQSGYANATPTIFLGSVTFRDGKVIEFTNSFAGR